MILALFNFNYGEFYNQAKAFDWAAITGAVIGAGLTLIGFYLFTRWQVRVIKKDQFESSFFNILSMLNQIAQNASGYFDDELYGNQFKSEGLDFFDQLTYRLKKMDLFNLKGKDKELLERLEPELVGKPFDEIALWEMSNGGKAAILRYEIIFNHYLSSLGHYYRYIHNMIDFAIHERRKYKDDGRYINLIQAQLSNGQLVMLFYNALSRYSLNMKGVEKFKNRIDYYQVLQNINDDDIFESLTSRYPMTLFRFFSAEELTEQKILREVAIKRLDNSIWN